MRAFASLALAAGLLVPRAASAQAAPGTAPSAADLESARELFKEARELRQKGDSKTALERFKAAHAYGQTPVTGLELGRTHMELGELVEAREIFLGVGRLKIASDETEKSASARTEAAELAEKVRPRIPTIMVKLTSVAPDAHPVVLVDGAPIPVVSNGAVRKVNPGAHVVVVRPGGAAAGANGGTAGAPGGPEERRDVVLAEGESKDLVVDLAGSSAAAHDAGSGDAGASGQRKISPLTWVGLGLGVAGLGTGAVAGVIALGKASDVTKACTGTRCPPSAKNTVDGGRTAATISTVGFAAGLAGVGLAAVGWFVLSPRTTQPGARARGLQVIPVVARDGVGLAGAF
jgi:hypothetical protein